MTTRRFAADDQKLDDLYADLAEADLQPHPQARIGHVIGRKLAQRAVASLSAFGHQRQVHP